MAQLRRHLQHTRDDQPDLPVLISRGRTLRDYGRSFLQSDDTNVSRSVHRQILLRRLLRRLDQDYRPAQSTGDRRRA